MDNAKHGAPARSVLHTPLRRGWERCRAAAGTPHLRALVPSPGPFLEYWIALARQPRLALLGLVVLFAFSAIVTALARAPGAETPVVRFSPAPARGAASSLPSRWPPDARTSRPDARERDRARPGMALAGLPAAVWLRAAVGLPEQQLGAPLSAYEPATLRVRWLCVFWALIGLAWLPVLVMAARGPRGAVAAPERPWARWRALWIPFALAGLALLPAVWAGLRAGIPLWVLALPPAQALAQIIAASAIALAVSVGVPSTARALVWAYILSLGGCLAMAPLVALATAWLTGWSAVLPDPEIPAWIPGRLSPVLWLLAAGAVSAFALAFAHRAADGGTHSQGSDEQSAPGSPAVPVRGGLRLARGVLVGGALLIAARLVLGAAPGAAHQRGGTWQTPLFARHRDRPLAAPPGMRRAFRAFGAGEYQEARAIARPAQPDVLVRDDRSLLDAACLLRESAPERVARALGTIRVQYGAALAAREAAALRLGKSPGGGGPQPVLLPAAFKGAGGAEPRDSEAAGLERILARLEEAEYVIYSRRREAYVRVPYRLYPRPGQVAVQLALLRRLVELRPRDAEVRIRLARALQRHERLLTESSFRESQERALWGLKAQREELCHEALRLNPRSVEAMVLLGRLDDAIPLRPKDVALRRLRIERAEETGETRHLVGDARAVVALTGTDEARFTLALAEVQAGSPAGGLRELRALLERGASGPLPDDYATWVVSYAALCCRSGKFAEARAALARAINRGVRGDAPIEPATFLALLRCEAGDRRGALAALRHLREDERRGVLPSLLEAEARGGSDRNWRRRRNTPLEQGPQGIRFLSWTDGGVPFSLEPVARRLLKRQPRSLVGRYVLADALASRAEQHNDPHPPDAPAREALEILHGLTRELPEWIAPFESLAALCWRIGHSDRAAAYERLVRDMLLDKDRSPVMWQGRINGLQPGAPRSWR